MESRENFKSRIGFIMTSAGCAIGLGNVWRFPFITGKYGGAAFVLFYLLFLVILGLPIMVMEFSVGRASQRSAAKSFHILEPKGTKWHIYSWFAVGGNYLLMMFYTTVAGWMLSYVVKMLSGQFDGASPEQIASAFSLMLSSPGEMVFWMFVVILIGFAICMIGLKNGVEKASTIIMTCLLYLMIVLAFRSITLKGAAKGLAFYLKPDFSKMIENGMGEVIFAAMGQAFFTLSLGIGALAIFGSYIGKERALTGEAVNIILLDTFVALMSGLIIFPACAAFDVSPGQGPGLIFITLPNIFNNMKFGRLWGVIFFLFMSFASISTVIAVFENIIASVMELCSWNRKKAVIVNIILVTLLSLPCALGFNVWSFIAIPKIGGIQDIEDFILSNNLLPLGSLVYLLFCTSRYGWGFENFLKEANTGRGIKFPHKVSFYVKYILPLIVLGIWVVGYIQLFLS